MTLVIVPQFYPDVGYRKTCIEKIMNRQIHAEIEEILEYRGAKLLLEGFLQGAFVGAHHRRQLVKRRHFLVMGEDDALCIVYLVTDAEAEGLDRKSVGRERV